MTDNDLILMAHDAGFPIRKQLSGNVQIAGMSMKRFRSFAERAFAKGYRSGCSAFAMAVEIEREACAAICDENERFYNDLAKSPTFTDNGRLLHEGMRGGSHNCAVDIRARATGLGVGIDESRDAGQTGPCARAHVTPANSYADCVCCDSVPTPNDAARYAFLRSEQSDSTVTVGGWNLHGDELDTAIDRHMTP